MIATVYLRERIDDACVDAVRIAISRAHADAARVLVIEGAPDRFCLGMDFQIAGDAAPRYALARFAALLHELATAPLPTLAVVDGPALGGGLGIAAACDVVIATDQARFGLPEALYGLAPAIIRPVLAHRITPAQLTRLVVTCRSRDAQEALRLGLVDHVVARDELELARARAIRELGRAHPDTVAVLRAWAGSDLATRLAAGVDETTAALARPSVSAALRTEEPAWL